MRTLGEVQFLVICIIKKKVLGRTKISIRTLIFQFYRVKMDVFFKAVIFGQNGLLSGPVGSRGPEVVAQNWNMSKFRKTSIFKALKEQ